MKTDLTGSPDQAEIADLVGHLRIKAQSFTPGRAQQAADALEILARDARRIDWLADPTNHMGQVHLPFVCVEQNLHSMRAAIDAAMALASTEEPDA